MLQSVTEKVKENVSLHNCRLLDDANVMDAYSVSVTKWCYYNDVWWWCIRLPEPGDEAASGVLLNK